MHDLLECIFISRCVIIHPFLVWYIVELTYHSVLFGTPDSPSAVHVHHLQLLLFLGIVTTSGFHGDIKVSCLTVGTHLKQLQKKQSLKIYLFYTPNLTTIMIITKKCWPVLAESAAFSVVDRVEKLAATDFVGDITHQQPVTLSLMSRD